MTLQDIIEEIKLDLTGGILELEIDDSQIEQVVKKELRELEQYFDETNMITVPYAPCIDCNGEAFKERVNTVVRIYRTTSYGENANGSPLLDPMYIQQWNLFSNGGTMYNLNDYILNYASWNTLMQIKNTMSTDMAFKEDKHNNKLYINQFMDKPQMITIEYVPKLTSVEAIQSDYWIDILIKLSIARTKVILGRIRTRFTQSNPLWTQDGEKLLEEGNTELKELLTMLQENSNMVYPID